MDQWLLGQEASIAPAISSVHLLSFYDSSLIPSRSASSTSMIFHYAQWLLEKSTILTTGKDAGGSHILKNRKMG